MRATVRGLLVLLLVALVRADTYYDGEYNYDDNYDYRPRGGYEYPEETHEYPDEVEPPPVDTSHRQVQSPPRERVDEEEETHLEYNSDDGRICARSCSVSRDSDVLYEPGREYRYQYHGEVVTKSRATLTQESRMTVRAYVIITARTQCDLKLSVMNLAVDDVPTPDSQWFRDAVEKYDLHFSYTNGMVSYLCPHEEEEVVATNFKRGILSAIQAKMTNMQKTEAVVYEADVIGECQTEYHLTQPSELVINKTKSNCRYNNYLPYVPSQHYSRKELTGQIPFQSSKQNCMMHLQDRIWNRVECVEQMEVKEFQDFFREDDSSSNSNSNHALASVTVTTTLALEAGPEDSQTEFAKDGVRKRRASLRMDLEGAFDSLDKREHHGINVPEQIRIAVEYLKATMNSDSGILEKRSTAFSHLVTLLGQLEEDSDMDDVWETYSSEQHTRQFVLDAAVLCESRACMKLLTRLAVESPEYFPETRVLSWLVGVHFHTKSHPDNVKYLMEVAHNNAAVEHQTVMAASSIVYQLCRRNPFTCRDHAAPLLDYAVEKIGDSCGYGGSEEDLVQVKHALRALSNAGVLPEGHVIERCYKNKLMKPEIRVAAFETYRRVSCRHLDLETPWQILDDADDEVDVRIAAYLSLVMCAPETPNFFTRVKNFLHKEEVNQVGGYIWTHVNNLAEKPGGNSYSRELSQLANHHTLRAKFTTNAFRTSRNYRWAQFSEMLNVGASLDSDLIFTPRSYFPRIEHHKFHVDFLENSIDAFEIIGEFENMEDMVQDFFSKGQYLENEEIYKVLETIRPKRDINADKIQKFQEMYDEARTANEVAAGGGGGGGGEEGGEEPPKPKAIVHFRVFGSEIFYQDLLSDNLWEFLQKVMREMSNPRSFQILQQELMSPTILGFPLRLHLNATGSINYEDTTEFSVTPSFDIKLDGQIKTSTVLAMDETLMIDGYGSTSGVRRRSTHISSTDFGLKVDVQKGKLADFQFNVPKQEVARVTSSVKVALYENHRQDWNEADYEGPSEKFEYCSPDDTRRITGLEYCSSSERALLHTDSEEPIPGDVYSAEYTLTKADTFDYYQLLYKNEKKDFEFTFDTPGSSVDRKVSLQVRLKPGKAKGTLTIPGKSYDVEGNYENTAALKKFALQYTEDSVSQGNFEVVIPMTADETGFTVTPKISLNLNSFFDLDFEGTLKKGTGQFLLEGHATCSQMENPMDFKASWEATKDQHKIEGNVAIGEVFGSTSGTLFLNGEKTLVQIDSEYGTSRDQPNTLAFTFDKTLLVEAEGVRHTGYLSVESSVGNTNVELEYDYGSDHAIMDTNVTVVGTEVTSKVIVKNEFSEGERDLEVTLSFASPQLDVNYLGQAIYKISDNAFLGEVEVTLGADVNTKLSASYLYEVDPLHLQGGFHFHLNDFVVQFAHEIDFSQPGIMLITSSDVIGPAAGVLQLEAFYDKMAPFNASLDVHAGYGNDQFGLKASTSSNEDWSQFEGSTEAIWFDWSYNIQHEVEWGEHKKNFLFTCQEGNTLNVFLQTDPDIMFNLAFQRADDGEPLIKYGIERRTEESGTTYETYLQSQGNDMFHLTATDSGDNSYSGTAKFLDSQVEVAGKLTHTEEDHLEGEAQATLTFPSGETQQSEVTFKKTYDGKTRDLQFSSSYGGEVIQGHLTLTHKDGWFNDDERKVVVSLETPFDGLKKVGMSFESHGDWAEPWHAEAEWEEIKVRGEIQLADVTNLEGKLEYIDGGSCDSIVHFYNKYDGQHFKAGAVVGITKARDPWSIELTATENQDTKEHSLDITLNCQSPLMQAPFEAKGKYKLTDTNVTPNLNLEQSQRQESRRGENEALDSEVQKRVGSLNLDSPWFDPVFFSVENLQDAGSFNVTVDLRTTWEHVNTVTTEFSVNYAKLDETSAHFYLNHQNLQITLEMIHNLSDGNLVQQMQGSVNTVVLNYNLNAKWDENFIPENSEGQLSLNGFLDSNFEFIFSHTREENKFNSRFSGTWDTYQVRLIHFFEFDHPLKWSSDVQLNLPEEKLILARLFLNSQKDLSTFESTFHLNTPWTEAFVANFEIHREHTPTEYELEATYGDTTLFNVVVNSSDSFTWNKVDVSMDVSSSLFDNAKLLWHHDLHSDNSVALEFSYGQHFHLEAKNHLKYEESIFNKELKGYEMSAALKMEKPNLDFKANFAFEDSISGEFRAGWYDYSFTVKSSIPDNTVFAASLSYPEEHHYTELLYEKGTSNIPNFSFKYSKNDNDILRFNGEFSSSYPQFDVAFNFYYFDEYSGIPKNGQLQLTADFSQIKDYQFKGMMKLNSDFQGFESFWGDIAAGMKNERDVFAGHLQGQLHVKDWHYKTQFKLDLNTGSDFKLNYNSSYDLTQGDEVHDKKDFNLKFEHSRDDIVAYISITPKWDMSPWSAYVSYSFKDISFKTYVIPGNEEKYEVTLNVTKNVLRVDAQRSKEDGDETFSFLRGTVNWNMKKIKKQIVVNFTSDIPSMKNIKGQIVIQQRKGMAANFKLRVNDEDLTGLVRFIDGGKENAGKIMVKIENKIIYPFTTNSSVQYSLEPDGVTADLEMEVDGEKDWVKANVKGSLSESYIRFSLPIENFNDFDLTVTVETDPAYGLNVDLKNSLFCFSLSGSLHKFFETLSLVSSFTWECSGEPVYDFKFQYDFNDKNNVSVETYLKVKNFGNMFRFSINGSYLQGNDKLTIETEIYPSYHHITNLFISTNEAFSLGAHTQDGSTEDTLFQFEVTVSKKETRVEILVGDIKVVSLQSEYDLNPNAQKFDASFMHTIFGHPFSAKLNFNGKIEYDSGEIEMHLSTDGSFDHADFTMDYNRKGNIIQGNFKLETSNGNAEGKTTLEMTKRKYDFKAEMHSTIHTFENYQVEFFYERLKTGKKLDIKTVQDDIEFELHSSQLEEDGMLVLHMDSKLPLEKFGSFEVNLGYPTEDSAEPSYKVDVEFVLSNQEYKTSFQHKHSTSWRNQETIFSVNTPVRLIGKHEVIFKYDLDGQTSFSFESYKGQFGLNASWELKDGGVLAELGMDLSYFQQGEYKVKVDIPLKIYQRGEFEFSRHNSDLDFDIHILVDDKYRSGEFTLNVHHQEDKKTYLLNYNYKNRLDIEVQWDTWTMSAKAKLTGKKVPASSGTINITTNFEGFETMKGSWDFQNKKKTYSTAISFDIDQKGSIKFDASLASQPKGISNPWEGALLEISFESPFTEPHQLVAEYSVPERKVVVSCKWGLEIFEVNLHGNVLDSNGDITLKGNLPVEFLSPFRFSFEYDLQNDFKFGLKAYLGETLLDGQVEVASDFMMGNTGIFWSSPFTEPLDVVLKWSFNNSPFDFETSWKYGKNELTASTKYEFHDNSGNFNLRFITPIKVASSIELEGLYDFTDSNDMKLSTKLKFNEHFFQTESKIVKSDAQFDLKTTGSAKAFDLSGSMNFEVKIEDANYNISFSGETEKSEMLLITGHSTGKDLQFTLRYGDRDIMNMNLDFSQAEVKFVWKNIYLNMTSNYKKVRNGYMIEYALQSSEMHPLTIKAEASSGDKYEGSITVMYGDKEYNVNGSLSLQARSPSLNFQFKSSEDSYNPIVVSAMYDISAFMQGKMKSEDTLADISFEWGEKLQMSLKGQRRGKNTKLDLKIITPFDAVPELHCGYEGNWMRKGPVVDLDFTAYFEWSEKVTVTGMFKQKKDRLSLELTVETPFPAFENFSVKLKSNPNHVEASLGIRDEEWNLVCDYEFSPKFSVSVTAKTPISGFREISLKSSAGMENQKLTGEAQLEWDNDNSFKLSAVAEMWHLEIHLDTPWEPLKNAAFTTFLRTESEELMYSLSLMWSSSVAEMSFAFSPVQLQLVGNYTSDGTEVGAINFGYHFDGASYEINAKLQVPFKKTFNVSAHLSFEETSVTVKMPFFYAIDAVLEAKDYWKEARIEASVDDPYGGTPYSFKMNYATEPEKYAIAGKAEVATDISLVSIDVDLMDDWRAEAHICDNISMNLTRTDEGVAMFGFNMENKDFNLEYLDFVATFGFLESPVFEDSLSVSYRVKGQELAESELRWQSESEDSQLLITLNLDSSAGILENVEISIPKTNIFQNDGKIEVSIRKSDEEFYRITYDAVYLQPPTFTHALTIQFPDWTADLSASLTRSNFKLSASYPNEDTKHTLLVSWPRDLSLEKLTLQIELSTPYLEEGDVQFLLDFTVQQRLHFTLTSSLSYGTNKIEMNGRFQFVKRERKVVVEATVTSDWVGNHSLALNAGWLRNITGSLKIVSDDQEHNANLLINKEEYTAEFTIHSPWISSKEVTVTGMMNKDIESHNILIEAKLEADENDYSIEGKFKSTDEKYIDGYFVMKRKQEDIFRVSGYFQFKANSIGLSLTVGSDVAYFSSNLRVMYENSEEKLALSLDVGNSFFTYINNYISVTIHKDWREQHSFYVRLYNWDSFRLDVKPGVEAGEVEVYIKLKGTHFKFDVEYDLAKEFEFEVSLQTPRNDVTVFHFEVEWPFSLDSRKEIEFYYQWYEDHVSFKFDLSPDSFFGWSAGAYLTSSLKGYERFSLQTPQIDSESKYIVLIEYPDGKIGLNAKLNPKGYFNHLRFTVNLPFEEYPLISLYFSTRGEQGSGIEVRVGKVGFAALVDTDSHEGFEEVRFLLSLNEYRSESYIRYYKHRERFRLVIHSDFEMKDIGDIKYFEFESRYDPSERLMIAAKTDQDELVKLHFAWGTDKIFAITTPKTYPGYLILNLESSENTDDYQVEVGLQLSRFDATWEKYGLHLSQKQLGYGRELHLSGKSGQSQFGIEGEITLHPMHSGNLNIRESLVLQMNEGRIGFLTYLQTDNGFFEDSYTGDLQIILPEQVLHWDTTARCSGSSFNLMSHFKWNDSDSEEEPIVLTLDYDDLSAISNNEHVLQAVFSYPQIQNITFHGNLTCAEDSVYHATAEFVDRNDPEKNIFFEMDSAPGSESGVFIVGANITQPSSNSVVELNAEITDSVFKSAAYRINYWSHSRQKWEVVHMTTEVTEENHGWHFSANLNKSESDWGYNYNGSLLHHDDSFFFSFMSTSQHFMDYWRLETTVNKFLPGVDAQLQIGQSLLEPHEIGRVRAGIHNPLEMGVIVDHERFGVWRQDARAGLRLQDREILQFIIEYDPSFDFSDGSLIYRLISPASKISNAFLRDLSYTGLALKDWASLEFQEIARVAFHQETFLTIQSYWKDKCNTFVYHLTSTFSRLEHDVSSAYEQRVKPFADSLQNITSDMYERIRFFFENNFPSFTPSWEHLVEFMSIEYVRVHDKFIEEWYRLEEWWHETNEAMSIAFKDSMYEVVRTINYLGEVVSEELRALQDTYGPTFESCRMAFERYGQELESVFGGQCWSRIHHQIQKVQASLNQVMYTGERFIQPSEYLRRMDSFREWFVEWYRENQLRFNDGLSRLQNAVRGSALFDELATEYEIVERFVRDMMRNGVYSTFKQRLSEIGPQIMAQADKAVRAMREKYHVFKEHSSGNIALDYLNAVTADALDRVRFYSSHKVIFDLGGLESKRIRGLGQNAENIRLVCGWIQNVAPRVLSLADEGSPAIIIEPKKKGQIIYNQHLPVPWNNFLEGPQWFRLVNIFQKESPLEESRRKLAEGMDVLYSTFGALFLPGSLIPPFTATATVYGQQITTFDLLHYQFLGTCTYLMTKDFVGGDFEVIGDYSRSDNGLIELESLTIRAQGADVTIHVDGRFEARNMGDAQVHTDENFVAFKQGSLLVSCNSVSRGCSVTVGSKYFGRLGGLLGNYNHEPSDDSEGPDGKKRHAGNDIANSWSVGSVPCYQENQVVSVEKLSRVSSFGNCHELFLRSESPLSNCFLRIDPRPYFWHCVRDMRRPSYGDEGRNTPCHASDAYRTVCAERNIHMPALFQCPRSEAFKVDEAKEEEEKEEVVETPIVRKPPTSRVAQAPAQRMPATCSVPEGETVPEGWSHTYEKETQGSADLAFVIELATCNKDRNLQLLLRLIKVTLKRGGIQDVKYALVTTQGGEIVDMSSDMISEEELNTQLGNLSLDGPKSDEGGAEAIKKAARTLKWRPGVARNIIQLPCRACNDGDAVAEALAENDVILHILTKFKVAMSGPNPKKSKLMANKVYGFDSKRIYTPKDTKKFTGNVNMRKLFQDPEDSSCFEAAQSSGGSIYNVNKWVSKSAVVEKKYLGVVGQSILKSSHAPECQECRCLRQGEGAEVSCRKCGEEWPAVEVQEVPREQVQQPQQVPQERVSITARAGDSQEESGNVAHDIKRTFKEEFIEANAAFAKLGDSQKEERGDASRPAVSQKGRQEEIVEEEEEEEEEPQVEEEEEEEEPQVEEEKPHVEEEEQEEEEEEEDESDEVEEYNYPDYYDYRK
ncbi:LOW QUALITY PROTEIN: uncharacterized protein LOC135197898 [Macrobrachium nipponense]|uniref:LOW QUALITY PROTEIN: uncharacterized protein LOC135197898 n=1 Tax=Macrobrachium nipponense TaxID=159736 RepID=UPI0030C88C03